MAVFQPEQYGERFAAVIGGDRLNELGPGSPNEDMEPVLSQLTPESGFEGKEIARMDMAKACVSGVWLLHDFLERSHAISQGIGTSTGSYWHGIMHRREPDASNASYWFRRVGVHPVSGLLQGEASRIAQEMDAPAEAEFLKGDGEWDPFKFIRLCEACRGSGSPLEDLCKQVQRREWELLFDYCYKRALGL